MWFIAFFQCFFQSILEFYSKLVEEHFHQFLDDFMNFSQKPHFYPGLKKTPPQTAVEVEV